MFLGRDDLRRLIEAMGQLDAEYGLDEAGAELLERLRVELDSDPERTYRAVLQSSIGALTYVEAECSGLDRQDAQVLERLRADWDALPADSDDTG